MNVGDSLTLSNGNRPVRISQMPSRSIATLRPAKLVVSAITFPPKNCSPKRDAACKGKLETIEMSPDGDLADTVRTLKLWSATARRRFVTPEFG